MNWDPVDRTVLANEQVDEQGRSWRSGALVEKRKLLQWYFRITQYADQLLTGLDSLTLWPEQVPQALSPRWRAPPRLTLNVQVKRMQRSWIGRSSGNLVTFDLRHLPGSASPASPLPPLVVFTTRVETIFGAKTRDFSPSTVSQSSSYSNIFLLFLTIPSLFQRMLLRRASTGARHRAVHDAHAQPAAAHHRFDRHAASLPPCPTFLQHFSRPQPQALPSAPAPSSTSSYWSPASCVLCIIRAPLLNFLYHILVRSHMHSGPGGLWQRSSHGCTGA